MKAFRPFISLLSRLPRTERFWQRFNGAFAAVLGGCMALLGFLIFLVDPLGVVPFSLPIDRPIVDIKQRHFYPLVIRSERYDSLVLGTSTSRLLDPADLDRTLGYRFANLALNDGRAWEAWSLADLYLREVGVPKSILIGLDGIWCHPEADKPENRITGRGFPDWIYDENPWNDLAYLVNGRMVEFAGRTLVTLVGLRPERLAKNGFAVFVPPEAEYDPERARQHIWGDGPRQVTSIEPAIVLTDTERAALPFPALQWIADLQRRTAGRTDLIYVWMPVHQRSQPAPGSREAAIEAECKSRVDSLARQAGALVIDWRIPSPLTTDDANYWDALHYRVPVAGAIVKGIGQARTGQRVGDGRVWVTRTRPGEFSSGQVPQASD